MNTAGRLLSIYDQLLSHQLGNDVAMLKIWTTVFELPEEGLNLEDAVVTCLQAKKWLDKSEQRDKWKLWLKEPGRIGRAKRSISWSSSERRQASHDACAGSTQGPSKPKSPWRRCVRTKQWCSCARNSRTRFQIVSSISRWSLDVGGSSHLSSVLLAQPRRTVKASRVIPSSAIAARRNSCCVVIG